MEFGFPLFRRESTTRVSSFSFGHSNGFSFRKPSGFGEVQSGGTSPGVVEVHSANQWKAYCNASKQNDKLLVIEFTATWCRPCLYMEPTVHEFAANYTDVQFIKIDVDVLVPVAQQFEANTLPAFVLLKNGKEVDRVTGDKKNELRSKIEKHRASSLSFY